MDNAFAESDITLLDTAVEFVHLLLNTTAFIEFVDSLAREIKFGISPFVPADVFLDFIWFKVSVLNATLLLKSTIKKLNVVNAKVDTSKPQDKDATESVSQDALKMKIG